MFMGLIRNPSQGWVTIYVFDDCYYYAAKSVDYASRMNNGRNVFY